MSEVTTATVHVTVRYFAGAGAAARVEQEVVEVAADALVRDVLDDAGARRGADLVRVIAASSVLVDGVQDRERALPVRDGLTVDVLPPFAGG